MVGRSVSVAVLAAALCGCSHAGSIVRTSADYNKAMASVRNEQLLLNIMRAAAREPLQFSAMGEINTTFDRSGELDSNLNNLIVGGVNSITQVLKLGGANRPVVRISPLSNREFTTGMLRRTTPETLKEFMDLGWDAEFVLPLLVRGYRCPHAASFTWLRGTDPNLQALVSRISAAGTGARWSSARSIPKQVELQVADDKALEMLRTGLAGGYRVDSIRAASPAGMSLVKLVGPETKTTTMQLPLCTSPDRVAALESANEEPNRPALTTFKVSENAEEIAPLSATERDDAQGEIVFRSVEGIIYFLGERLRHCYLDRVAMQACALTYGGLGPDPSSTRKTTYLLQVSSGSKPGETAVGATYYGSHYWVARLDREDGDRTMKTFAFLNQLIALQTSASATGSTTTVLAIGGN